MNAFNLYLKGEQVSNKILELIKNAKRDLFIASYVLSDFKISRDIGFLFDLLAHKLQENVDVFILLGRTPPNYVQERMEKISEAIVMICPRTHLKTIIADRTRGIISTGNITSRGTLIASEEKQNFELAVSIDKEATQRTLKLVVNILHGDYCTKKYCRKFKQGECSGVQEVMETSDKI